MGRRRGARSRTEEPSSTEILTTFIFTIALPILLLTTQGITKEAVIGYAILGTAGWVFLFVAKRSWLKFRGGKSLIVCGVTVATMYISGMFASKLASQASGLTMTFLPFALALNTVTVTTKTAFIAFETGWAEESLYGGLLYGAIDFLGFLGKLITALVFAAMHFKAYPSAWLMLAPFITRIVECYLIDWEEGIIGVLFGHATGNAIILLMLGGVQT